MLSSKAFSSKKMINFNTQNIIPISPKNETEEKIPYTATWLNKGQYLAKLDEHLILPTLEQPGDTHMLLDDPDCVAKCENAVRKFSPDIILFDPWGDLCADELKDDVLIRKNGNPTYFAADIAYHKNKFERGFTTLIDIWGADHHGHVMRMKGAMDAVGCDGSRLHVVLMQLVKLVRNGELVKMSKRTGKAIQLRDLLEEVPVDSARFLFNTREANTQMDFDLDLAVTQDNQNPVYYVQYAHARICSIFKSLAGDGITPRACSDEELALLTAPEEKELISHLALYGSEIISAAKDYDPTKITRYVTRLATLFHKFYNACRVKGEDEGLTQARLALCSCVRAVIKNVLTMFNITCPESM